MIHARITNLKVESRVRPPPYPASRLIDLHHADRKQCRQFIRSSYAGPVRFHAFDRSSRETARDHHLTPEPLAEDIVIESSLMSGWGAIGEDRQHSSVV